VSVERTFKLKLFFLLTFLAVIVLTAFLAEPVSIALTVYFQRNLASLPLPSRPAPHDRAEANLQDLEDLRLLPGIDRSFSPAAKAAFLKGVDALSAQAAALSPAGMEMAVSRLVALAGNGHTTVSLSQRASQFGRIPVRFGWFADGLYVVQGLPAFADLLGAQVLAIDGHRVECALSAVRPFISGTDERARSQSTPILESPALLQAVWPDTDGVQLTISLANGGDRTLAAMPPARDASGWETVLSNAPAIPLSLRTPDRVALSAPLEKDGIYVRIDANDDDAQGPLTAQLDAILDGAPPGGWRWAVLDLRFNDGGDELKTMSFARALPKAVRSDGDIYILTGNATFSAAIITAARVKYFAGGRAHIVGERAGDRSQFWTDGGAPLVLRNSGIAIYHAYFKQDWADGCHSIRLCHPYNLIYGVAAGDLTPEITVGWRFSDYAEGRDTVMEAVAAMVNRSQSPN
jgi:hypothetical protein